MIPDWHKNELNLKRKSNWIKQWSDSKEIVVHKYVRNTFKTKTFNNFEEALKFVARESKKATIDLFINKDLKMNWFNGDCQWENSIK